MNIDFLYLFQILMLIMTVIGVISFTVRMIQSARFSYELQNTKCTVSQVFQHIREMSAEDYVNYQKYQIWRFYLFSRA